MNLCAYWQKFNSTYITIHTPYLGKYILTAISQFQATIKNQRSACKRKHSTYVSGHPMQSRTCHTSSGCGLTHAPSPQTLGDMRAKSQSSGTSSAHTKHNQNPNELPHQPALPSSLPTKADLACVESTLCFQP